MKKIFRVIEPTTLQNYLVNERAAEDKLRYGTSGNFLQGIFNT